MPEIRKLSPEEIESLKPKPEGSIYKQILEEYQRSLQGFQPGDWGEMKEEEGITRLSTMNRLRRAARSLGWKIHFKRTRGNLIRFEIIAG